MAILNFKGKTFVQNHHLTVKYHQMIPQKDKSLTDKVSLNDNLIIHGDNLIALKALLPTYGGKVNCIYIDPPYNTGNEKWVYNDDVNSPMIQEWLGKVVDKDDLTRHDKWLCMMMPRLKLLRELLHENGVIFVSIDDYEIHHLRALMDEVFGEQNYISTFVWKRRASSALAEMRVSKDHEYVICYMKMSFQKFVGDPKDYSGYSNPDNDPEGDWTLGDLTIGMTKEQRPNQYYDLVDPKTGIVFKPNQQRVWTFFPKTMKDEIKRGHVVFPTDPNGQPMYKRYKKNLKTAVNPISTWIRLTSEKYKSEIFEMSSGLNSEGTKHIQQIFGKKIFDYPKPLSLIKSLIQQATDKDSIILDSFSGTATTAHAVLSLNEKDTGHRKFILVECEEYADTITAERVRRVIRGVKESKDDNIKKGLGGSFSFFELGKPIRMESILQGDFPDYVELARYIFYTATGEEFDPKKVKEKSKYIGESKDYEVYLFYQPDIEYLKSTSLTLDVAKKLGKYTGKERLVFAPSKYLDLNDSELIEVHGIKGITYCQLPFEIYKLKG